MKCWEGRHGEICCRLLCDLCASAFQKSQAGPRARFRNECSTVLALVVAQMPDTLFKMPGVNNRLPKLSNATSEQLEMLMQKESIKDLKIDGLEEGATVAQVAQLIEKHDELQILRLSRIPWTKELAGAICKCDRLVHLDLEVDGFDGRFLNSADQLRRLKSMTLEVD